MTRSNLLLAGRVVLGLFFFLSGFSKLIQPIEYFEVAVRQYELIPDAMVHYFSYVIPWIEFVFGTYLLLGYSSKTAAAVLSVLTGVFQLTLGQALVRHLPFDECGCFGGGFVHMTLFQSFTMDTVLLLVLIQLATSEHSKYSLDNYLKPVQ